MHSYHIFYFPFKWEIEKRKKKLFAEQTNLDNIDWNPLSNWLENPDITDEKEKRELYDEKNYYYEFVHPVLYDTGKENSILKHFERKEPQQRNVSYIISKHEGKTYTLKVDAINLNLYETGVGMLSFFLKNERDDQKAPEDILNINQYGRRIFPPFFADIEEKHETAGYIAIEGLNGEASLFYENFSGYIKDGKIHKGSWTPACFITNLIYDLYDGFKIAPVIDDRMFVNCWYGNKTLTQKIKNCKDSNLHEFFLNEDFWYKYLYVDVNAPSCKNEKMKLDLLDKQTYKRWQSDEMMYGITRYSFVMLSPDSGFHKEVFATHMQTTYSRMIELILIQRASVLRFSDEVANVGQLSKVKSIDRHLIEKISSIYKEYIRFTNQIYFREVTAQDQGIELYNLMSGTLNLRNYVEGLDKEIQELYQYVTLVDDKIRNKNAEKLNIIAAIFLPATLATGLFGMNYGENDIINNFWYQALIVLAATGIMFILLQLINKKK